MTGAERLAVATTRENLPTLGSTGLLTAWLGVAGDDEGRVIVTTLDRAASLARGLDGDPVVAEVAIDIAGSRAAIPWAAITALHFESPRVAREFTARSYDNFNVENVAADGDESLFAVPAVEVPEAPPAPPDHRIMDRLAGAAGAALALPLQAPFAEERDKIVRSLLATLRQPGTGTFTQAISSLLTSDADEALLLDVVTRCVLDLPEDAELGSRVFLQTITDAIPDPSPGLAHALDYSMDIAKSTVPLPTLEADKGLRAAKSLLLFVLQPEPRSVTTTASSQPADPASVLVSALLSGLFRGWTRFPAVLRDESGTKATIERALADALDDEDAPTWMPDGPEIRGPVTVTRAIVSHTDEIAGPTTPPEDADGSMGEAQEQLPLGPQSNDPKQTTAPIGVQLAALLEASGLNDQATAERLASICKRLGWDDLVTTEIVVGSSDFSWSEKRIKIPGAVVVERVVDTAVLERLHSFEGRVPAEMTDLTIALGGSKLRRPRKSAEK